MSVINCSAFMSVINCSSPISDVDVEYMNILMLMLNMNIDVDVEYTPVHRGAGVHERHQLGGGVLQLRAVRLQGPPRPRLSGRT